MCNSPPLCVPYCGDYHGVLEFDGREQRSKIDEGIILQVSSRESLEKEKKNYQKSTAIICSGCPLCLSGSALRPLPLLWPISVTLC